ncbi:MAG: hypothetical protein FD180_1541 [Planctomycetota bacterium]|nr:MAG: hypothetical protein FD180_1541 [Planctomycetota bacterium]
MPEREIILKSIDFALQVSAYDQLGPAGADLAAGARRELAALTVGWTEAARACLASTALNVDRDRHQLDRGRNHFIKDFRQRHGVDARGYAPEVRAQLEAGMADFNQRKLRVIEEASARLLAELKMAGHPA